MKNLFASFTCMDSENKPASGNICITSPIKINGTEDIEALQLYIARTYGLTDVVINNWRRME